ncbi:MAG TPA: APC family permease [Chloroflexia bacterium]|nr:APC family permease [Chloroflexia bacterium]
MNNRPAVAPDHRSGPAVPAPQLDRPAQAVPGEPSGDPAPALYVAQSPSAGDAPLEQEEHARADRTADVHRAMPAGSKRSSRLMTAGARLTAGELENQQVHLGTHPGDRRIRRMRPAEDGFRRLGPGHLEALPATLAPTTAIGRVFAGVKRLAIGRPLSTASAEHERLNKAQALAVLSSDALSSVAYATQAVLGALLLAGEGAFALNIPISLAIAALIAIIIFSYRQTIYAYPKGGGSYIVARSNLGTLPGLVAAASLLTDYVLTVAVSVSAGVAAIVSLAPQWDTHRVAGCLVAIGLILLLNLRGLRESGTVFAIPTYMFLITIFGMLGYGLFQYVTGTLGHVADVPNLVPPGGGTIGALLILSAFSNGCTALTGIEAISDGVPAFRAPVSRNAAQTLVTLGVLLSILFLGISFLADHVGVHVSTTETVLSQVGRTVFAPLHLSVAGQNLFWFILQWATALILVLAANTSFSDFPRLAFFLARDRFLPHQFAFRGDKLAYSFGIITLALLAALLVVLFGGVTDALLPLYAIGVFSSFTLSQLGMVTRWRREQTPGWQRNALINGAGAGTTCTVLLILAWTKFADGTPLFTIGGFTVNAGAWIVLVLVPLIVLLLVRIHNHYESLRGALSLAGVDPQVGQAAAVGATLRSAPAINLPNEGTQAGVVATAGDVFERIEHLVVMPIAGVNQVTLRTLAYARSITDNVVAVHVAADEEPEAVAKLEAKWHTWIPDVPLVVVESPYRSLFRPLLSYIDALHRQQPDRVLTVLIPEFVTAHWWEQLLHNQSALRLKGALLFRPGIVVTSVPYHIDTSADGRLRGTKGRAQP